MDPISQAFVGVSAVQLAAKRANINKIGKASLIGGLAAMSPDLDIFIRSSSDPLLAIQFHRHFTHSLLFVPIGALINAIFFYYLFQKFHKFSFKETYFYCFLGYVTHGLLDALTSYGTHLMWPLTNHRVSLGYISIIDPIFTFTLIFLTLFCIKKYSRKLAIFSVIFMFSYFSLGILQYSRATNVMYDIAREQGHTIEHFEVKPSIGNNILYRLTYLYNGRVYNNAVRVTWLGDVKIYKGKSAPHVKFPEDFKFAKGTKTFEDISRFNFFSNNLLITHPDYKNILIDGRYSPDIRDTKPMWAIKYNPNDLNKNVDFVRFGIVKGRMSQDFKKMMWGENPEAVKAKNN